jgi:cytochrome c oxidase subunit I
VAYSDAFLDRIANTLQSSGLVKEVRYWGILGISALAVAGIFALLLAISRIPGIENTFPWPIGFFEKGLVIHVIMSFVVWFLAIFGALMTVLTALAADSRPRLAFIGNPAIALATTGFALLAIPAMLDRGEASLNNYIPVIIDPLYYAGLISFAASLVLIVVRFSANMTSAPMEIKPLMDAGAVCGLILIFALTCFGLAYYPMADEVPSIRYNEDLFWGGGHVLQYLNTGLMLLGWYLLAALVLNIEPVSRGRLRLVMGLCLIPAFGAPYLYGSYGAGTGELMSAFTDMQYLMAPPVALLGFALIFMFAQHAIQGGKLWQDVAFVSIALSAVTFAIGGTLGLFVDGADTRTPAHYHAVIAAINLVFMGLFFRFLLPVMGRPVTLGRAVHWLLWLYAVGQMIASVGLFLAGGYGAPRKTAGDAQGLEEIGAIAGLYMNGLGALVAVIGGTMFIWVCARALLRR